jgi:hypothetical protein
LSSRGILGPEVVGATSHVSSNTPHADTYAVQTYAAAFIDLLGIRGALKRLEDPTWSGGGPKEIDDAAQAVRIPIRACRDATDQFLEQRLVGGVSSRTRSLLDESQLQRMQRLVLCWFT